jgi:hypothetical protein
MGGLPDGGTRRGPDARRLNRLMEIDNERVEEHEREPDRGKVTLSDVHRHLMRRVDDRREVQVLAATKRDLPPQVWLIFLALELGWVADERGILRPHRARQEPKPRYPSVVEVAAHYGLAESTVRQYGRQGRRVYRAWRERADDLDPWE